MIRSLVISLFLLGTATTPVAAQTLAQSVLVNNEAHASLVQERYRISASQARQIVRNQYPNASRVIVAGINERSRRPYWEVRVEIDGRRRTVKVDANSGAIF